MNNRTALLWSISLALLILTLFYYWFAVADRYAVFLYYHTTVGIPRAQPFDEHTSSRYWMAGLVAAGIVLVLYATLNWLLGCRAAWRHRAYAPPAWWLVWLWAAPLLSAGIPLITMTVNSPVLPPTLALACTIAALVGVGFALLPGEWAATQPMALAWLTAESVGLMPALLLVRTVELPDRGISVSPALAWTVAIGGLLAGSAWLGGMSVLRHRWGRGPTPTAAALFAGGICLSYLFLPLIHHLLATPPGFLYISTASNFFAFDFGLQMVAMTIAAGMAVGVTWLRSGTHGLR